LLTPTPCSYHKLLLAAFAAAPGDTPQVLAPLPWRAFFLCFAFGVGGAILKIVTGDVYGGTLSRIQFSGMACAAIVCAVLGGRAALRRDFSAHEGWMWRTYLVLWSSSVASRLGILFLVPVVWRWMGGRVEDYPIPYNAVLAASWSLPLLVRFGPKASNEAGGSPPRNGGRVRLSPEV
jgi:hypothetical protein